MSFSLEQKQEIIGQKNKNACCRRALALGILVTKGRVEDGISVSLDGEANVEFLCALIKELYSKEPSAGTSPSGGRRRIVKFTSSAAEKAINTFHANGRVESRCDMCTGAFLRGVFLGCGRVSDPSKQLSLEFSPVSEATEGLFRFLSEIGLAPRISKKKNETLIYFRNSTEIEDFFGYAGMNNTAFAFMNAKIVRDLRNKANRISNCESNNINRSVSTSMNQIQLISELINRGLISQLPEELEMTARLRMEYSDLSLARLAALITPPISKPGLSHRLKKITSMAEKLLKISD